MIFDSSVLIAACLQTHPKHQEAFHWLTKAKNKEIDYIVATHSILEVYSVLTGAPFKPPISPSMARRIIENNIKKDANLISLSVEDYFQIIENMETLGLRGGIIYDAIVVECARKSGNNEILTLNPKNFLRLVQDSAIKIISV